MDELIKEFKEKSHLQNKTDEEILRDPFYSECFFRWMRAKNRIEKHNAEYKQKTNQSKTA